MLFGGLSLGELYSEHWKAEFEFLRKYVENLELQITESRNLYEKNKEVEWIQDSNEDNVAEGFWGTEYYLGLDGSFWNLVRLFNVEFPSMQRSAALISFYSFFEKELNSLCDRIKTEESYPLSVEDIKEDGIKRAIQYLNKVCRFPITWDSLQSSGIRAIQMIRNKCVHHGGVVQDKDGKIHPLIAEFVSKHPSLELTKHKNELIIHAGFLELMLKILRDIFDKIEAELMSRYPPKKD